MPYIEKWRKDELHQCVEDSYFPETPGELNYLITVVCLDYLDNEISYAKLNEVVGALECAKLEFYRRAILPYEEKKIEQNGDVY